MSVALMRALKAVLLIVCFLGALIYFDDICEFCTDCLHAGAEAQDSRLNH